MECVRKAQQRAEEAEAATARADRISNEKADALKRSEASQKELLRNLMEAQHEIGLLKHRLAEEEDFERRAQEIENALSAAEQMKQRFLKRIALLKEEINLLRRTASQGTRHSYPESDLIEPGGDTDWFVPLPE